MATPAVSVVVATRDRPARLAALLAGLRRQRVGAGDAFEVVVVDDGSGPETAARLEAERAHGELELVVRRHEASRGPGAARNTGWRSARALLVAFTDDDCVPEPGWLASGLSAHRAAPEAIVQGRTEPEPAELHRAGLFPHLARVQRLGPQYQTCNIFYPRELLERVGGFDETFAGAPGEDTDLAWRALALGRPARFAPEALVHHAVEERSVGDAVRTAWRWTGTVRLLSVHPATRGMLFRGLFWNEWHYLLVRSVLSPALPRPLRRLVLARHAYELWRRARRAGAGPASIPLLVAHDAVELAAVVRGALRYRTLAL
ncbi:MAG: glycosyltransferase [Actinomycetota bacterium]|nr:glycosyltransferase [Actinomycetota bacterium]